MKSLRHVIAVFLIGICFVGSICAETRGLLAGSLVLYGNEGDPPARLDSDQGWMLLGAIDWQDLPAAPTDGSATRDWRLKTRYEHDASFGPATLQIRLRGDGDGPTFTHPWIEGPNRQSEAYSNWYTSGSDNLPVRGRGYLEARLIAPPRTPLEGRVFDVTIEAWDVPLVQDQSPSPSHQVQLAYASPLPNFQNIETPPIDSEVNSHVIPTKESALTFSLGFLESCLTGDLPGYYRAHAESVRSLETGRGVSKFRLPPPAPLTDVNDLETYRRRFDYRIYEYEDFVELFPEWFEDDRPWIPGENDYLFIGARDRLSQPLSESVDYLVFLVTPDGDGSWSIKARP